MEDVLNVYARRYNKDYPVVCLDEKSKELHQTPRGMLPIEPGKSERIDSEYQRNGVANIFMQVEPLTGKCRVAVTDRRTCVDFAEQLRILVEEDYPQAAKVVLVTDNLNTHHIGCLYERLDPERAERIVSKLEWHYTPEHGSWLNREIASGDFLDMAEIELSVLSRQCLNRRISDKALLIEEVSVWQEYHNAQAVKIDWQFTTADARVKLRRLYPIARPATGK